MGLSYMYQTHARFPQEFISLAGAEVYRGNAEKEKRIYPGGPFDPLGLSKVCLQQQRLSSFECSMYRLPMVCFTIGAALALQCCVCMLT